MNYEKLVLELPATLRDALAAISSSGERIVFLTDEHKLIGSLSDGDVRRYILKGKSLDTDVLAIANRNVRKITPESTAVQIHKMFAEGISLVPRINAHGEIMEIVRESTLDYIPLCEPNLGNVESELVNQALNSNWISSAGYFVDKFELLFAEYTGANYALSVSNGTVGLVLALKTLDIKEGDEVLVPNLTFGATANAVIQVGAKPIFVDVEYDNMGISLVEAENKITNKTRAIIPVHLYGNAADMRKVNDLAMKYSLFVVEDCAEALGTYIEKIHVGLFGDIGVFSFYANKTITTGEGGMLIFRDRARYEASMSMRSHGFNSSRRYLHTTWGSNFRLTNLQAAVGLGQMERIEEFVTKKRNIASQYSEILFPYYPNILELPVTRPEVENSFWLFTLLLRTPELARGLMEYLQEQRVETRPFFLPLNNQPAFSKYGQADCKFPVSEDLSSRGVCLPSSTKISEVEISRICKHIIDFLTREET